MAAVAEVVPSMALQAYTVPVVGLWVGGVASASHPLVWAACLKFLATGQLQDKALMADGAFLLLLYQTGLRRPVTGVPSAGSITQGLHVQLTGCLCAAHLVQGAVPSCVAVPGSFPTSAGTAQPACFEVHVTGLEGSIPMMMWRGNISLRSGSRVVGDHLKCPLVQLRHITAALPISPGEALHAAVPCQS